MLHRDQPELLVRNRSRYTRRRFLQFAGATSAAALVSSRLLAEPKSGPEAVALTPGVQLFVDDYLIAEQKGITRVINQPTRIDHPIVSAKEDRVFTPYVSVLRDPQTRRFRMWFNSGEANGSAHIAYMESENGVDWIRPRRELQMPHAIDYGASVIDEGPEVAEKARRYKMTWDQHGVCTAFSADGINWSADGPQPAIEKTGDIVSLSRDPYRNRYLIIFKLGAKPSDGYKGRTANAEEGYRRIVGQSVSEDFRSWSLPQRIIMPDAKDEGITEYYSIGNVIARGGLLIGLLKVLRDDLPPEPGGQVTGIGYTVLAWTRDGVHWERDREAFLPRNPQPRTWDRAMTWGDCLLPVDDEMFIYYGGYARGHKVEKYAERQLGLARTLRDRFVAREAGRACGSLRTRPVVLPQASKLTVNANARGELRVRLCHPDGALIPGFDAADCAAIHGDSLSHEVSWGGGCKAPPKQPVCI
jgi:hypothetical protein